MSRKKTVYLVLIFIIIVISILGIVFFANNNKDYSSFIALGCEARLYEQKSDGGYLTISYSDVKNPRDIVVKVTDADLQSSLSKSDLTKVIGINLELKVPNKVLKERHISTDKFNAFQHLDTGILDEYLFLLDVFYK